MIEPSKITNFNRTDRELQAFWLFCIMVAGKNSDQTALKLKRMVENMPEGINPFDYFNKHDIHNFLVAHKVGQYGRISQAIKESINLDLRNATLDELMNVYGVGPKTARFFILHSRANAQVAVLDTHILKWLTMYGLKDVPDSTPNEKEYIKWEKIFLDICDMFCGGMPIAQVDLNIWNMMRMEKHILTSPNSVLR